MEKYIAIGIVVVLPGILPASISVAPNSPDNRFIALRWNDQTAVLKALESGKPPGQAWQKESARTFFEMVRDHSLQGFYGSPRHGGNRDYVSYRMLKLDYPQIIGQNRYKKQQGGYNSKEPAS
jgi:hypothetical protein